MKKTYYLLIMITVLVAVVVSACGVSVPPSTQAAPAPAEVATQSVAPAQPPVEQPTQSAPAGSSFAPVCQAASTCTAPDVHDTEVTKGYCVDKVPYQNIFVEPGTTFESSDPAMICKDSGTQVDGKEVIACHGKDLIAYDLKLTNPACGSSNLVTGTPQCQQGFGYDAAQNCCAQVTSSGGSVTIKVNMRSCNQP